MIGSTAFDYINILDKAADASWKRENLIANNIANADTPTYKRRDLDFESVLQAELGNCTYTSLDAKVRNANLNRLNPTVQFDYPWFSYRIDDNNVDIDTENVELASEQIKYQALTTGISEEFSRMRSVLQ